jgi:peroxiredoxin Q/BCP
MGCCYSSGLGSLKEYDEGKGNWYEGRKRTKRFSLELKLRISPKRSGPDIVRSYLVYILQEFYMAELTIGQAAPRFSLKDKDGNAYSLGKAEYTVLYFYPKDDTPGCTLEAKEFSHLIQQFKARNVQVVGVSGGNEKTKASFCKKHSLKVPLVSDTNFKVAKSYGAYGLKKFMGRTFQGIFRKTFLVDKAGKIVHIFDTVKPEGHAEEVLAAIDRLAKKGGAKTAAPKAKKATAKVKKVAPKAQKVTPKAKKAAPKAKKAAPKAAKRAVKAKKPAAKKK